MSNIHPAGTYPAKVVESGLSTSKNGTDQINVRFNTEHGSVGGFFFLTDKAAEWTMKKLAAMGFTGDSLADLNNGAIDGNECVVVVKHEEYNGEVKAKVDGVFKVGGGGVKKEEGAAANAKRFDALWKKVREETEEVPFVLAIVALAVNFIV